MRAVALTEYGDADVMSVQELPDPVVGPDVVLVRVAAVGVNPVDYKIRRGNLRERFPHHVPLVPGWDVAGEALPQVALADLVVHRVHPGGGDPDQDDVGPHQWVGQLPDAHHIGVPVLGQCHSAHGRQTYGRRPRTAVRN